MGYSNVFDWPLATFRRHPFVAAVAIILGVIFVLMSVNGSNSESVAYFTMFAIAGFAPTFVADARFHRNRAAIFALNLVLFGVLALASSLGVLIFDLALIVAAVGWIVALVWSFTANRIAEFPSNEVHAQFEAQGLYKGIPYRAAAGDHIEAMLPGGKVTFRNMEEFTTVIDGGTIQLQRKNALKAEFPNEFNDYLYRLEKNGGVSAVNGIGDRIDFSDWQSFWEASHRRA